MNIQAWTAALSVALAAIAFTFSLWVRNRDARQAALRDWQRVVVYTIVEETGSPSLKEIKSRYLERAQQLLSMRVSRKDIQDDTLRRILLDLQRDGVIVRGDDQVYRVTVKVPVESWAYEEIKRMSLERRLKPKLLSAVERESGQHTPESLLRRLHEGGMSRSFEEMDGLLYELRGYASLRLNAAGRLEFVPPYQERASSLPHGGQEDAGD